MASDHFRIHRPKSNDDATAEEVQRVAFVSFDIVGHSKAKDHEVQIARIKQLNALVRQTIDECGTNNIVWASGGDGGHVAFFQNAWQLRAIDLIVRLKRWSHSDGVPVRVVGHVGDVQRIEGADGRIQLVGYGINLAGRLLGEGFSSGVIASKEFKQSLEQVEPDGATFAHSRILMLRHFGPKQVHLLSVASKFGSTWDASSSERTANCS